MESPGAAAFNPRFLLSVWKADPDTIIAADGEYRDAFLVELYILPNDAYPP